MSSQTITTIADLVEAGLVGARDAPLLDRVAQRYAIAVTPTMLQTIDRADPSDPIARQFIPSPQELQTRPEETPDPISDSPFTPVKGIVHRYHDRALLKAVNVCPIYCRFCFRREMIGPSHGPGLSDAEIDAALAYVAATPSIQELIITGGDPLILSPRRVQTLTAKIATIPHVQAIRWHSRVPVVMPNKIDAQLIAALSTPRLKTRIALHANHPNEFGQDAIAACQRLTGAGFELLSQSVLLKGINDDAQTLAALMQAFKAAGARPYYLHHGDLAPGTSHFRTTIAAGLKLMKSLAACLPATLQPNYMLDVPGGSGKVALTQATCAEQADGSYIIRCRDGSTISYRDIVTP